MFFELSSAGDKAETIFKSANTMMTSTLMVHWLALQDGAIKNGMKFRRTIRNNDLYIMVLVYPIFLALTKNHTKGSVFDITYKMMMNEANTVDRTGALSFIIDYTMKNHIESIGLRSGSLATVYIPSTVYSFMFATFERPEGHIETIQDRQKARIINEEFYLKTRELFQTSIKSNQHIFKLNGD